MDRRELIGASMLMLLLAAVVPARGRWPKTGLMMIVMTIAKTAMKTVAETMKALMTTTVMTRVPTTMTKSKRHRAQIANAAGEGANPDLSVEAVLLSAGTSFG